MAPKKKEKEVAPPPQEEVQEEPPEEPPPPEPTEDELSELTTGLQLPLRGLDVGEVWALGEDWEQQEKLLVAKMGLEEAFPSVSQRSLVGDFHVFNLQQAKALCFSQYQGAVFHAIMHTILTMMRCPDMEGRRGSADMPCSPSDLFKRFQELIVKHSVHVPPAQLGVFKISDAKLLTDFASSTLFKHCLLYQFCINVDQEVQTLRFCRPLQRPLPGPDLLGAKLKPRRKSLEAAGSPGGGQGDENKAEIEAGSGGEDANPEDAEVERLVEEKLAETKAALHAKLEQRQADFHRKRDESKAAAPGSKGKKK